METRKKETLFLGVLALVALGVALQALQSVLFPLLLANLLAVVSRPLVEALRSRRVPMAVCILIVLVIVAAVLGLITVLLVSGVQSFVDAAPRYQAKLQTILSGASTTLESYLHQVGYDKVSFQIQDIVKLSTITDVLAASAGSLVTLLGTVFMTLLFMVFLLAAFENFQSKLRTAFVSAQAERISRVLDTIGIQIRRYVLAKTAISLVTASLVGLILMAFGVDFALFFGVLTFFLNFIPNIGSVFATLFPVSVALLQFDGPGTAIAIFVLLLVVQNLIGNILEPKLMGHGLDLDPVIILFSLIFWGWLWGIWGMAIAVPVASILKITFENIEALRPAAVMMGVGQKTGNRRS
jgi:AI-2 transport protein TqsA